MRIRTRALLVVVMVVASIGTVSLFVAWSLATRGLLKSETAEVRASLVRAEAALSAQVGHVERTSKDWSVWDDMYEFAIDRNAAFARANLFSGALETIDMDFMGIFDPAGRAIRVVTADGTQGVQPTMPVAVGDLLKAIPPAGTNGLVGVLATPEGLLLVSVQPILRSGGSGPRAGTLIMGKRLHAADISQLSQVTGDTVSLVNTRTADAKLEGWTEWSSPPTRASGVVVPADRDTVYGYKEIRGLDGRPAAVLSVRRLRTTMIMARETGFYLLIAIGIASLALVMGVIFSIDRIVTRRLARLSEDVRSITRRSDFNHRVDETGADEIATLGADINTMLRTLNDAQIELEYMAGHDMLTTLYNRRRFEEELERDVMEQARTGGIGAILWLDMDNFKVVNDTLGHAIGDRLLNEFSKTMKHETRGYATLARIGGDEFALILPNADRQEAEMTADRLIGLLRDRVFEIGEHRISVRVSIGIALYPDHGATTDELLVSADLAMYEAKNGGGDSFRVFTAPVRAQGPEPTTV